MIDWQCSKTKVLKLEQTFYLKLPSPETNKKQEQLNKEVYGKQKLDFLKKTKKPL